LIVGLDRYHLQEAFSQWCEENKEADSSQRVRPMREEEEADEEGGRPR